MHADIRGILNVLRWITNFCSEINPFIICPWGTVGDINGYLTPLAKFGEYSVVNPWILAKLGTFWLFKTP